MKRKTIFASLVVVAAMMAMLSECGSICSVEVSAIAPSDGTKTAEIARLTKFGGGVCAEETPL